MKFEFSGQIFGKYASTKFRENPPGESRVAPCGQTGVTKLIVAFRNFANAPKKMYTSSNKVNVRDVEYEGCSNWAEILFVYAVLSYWFLVPKCSLCGRAT